MPICKRCNKHFPRVFFVDGKERDFKRRKLCLECSPFDQKKKINICLHCGEWFPNKVKVDDREFDLHSRKYCLKCNPFVEKKIWGGKPSNITYDKDGKRILYEKKFVCKVCGIEREHKTRNLECTTCKSKKIRAEKKLNAVKFLGGECIVCGYNNCLDVLDIHHIDPEKKEFTLSQNLLKSWEIIKKELKKCVLMCANHHREYHAGRFCLLTDRPTLNK